jgi:hypothetical protein
VILVLDILFLSGLGIEVASCLNFVLLNLLHFQLDLLGELHLVAHPLSPELLALAELGLPLAELGFELLHGLSVGGVEAGVVLLLLLEQCTLPFVLQFVHLKLRELLGEVDDGN